MVCQLFVTFCERKKFLLLSLSAKASLLAEPLGKFCNTLLENTLLGNSTHYRNVAGHSRPLDTPPFDYTPFDHTSSAPLCDHSYRNPSNCRALPTAATPGRARMYCSAGQCIASYCVPVQVFAVARCVELRQARRRRTGCHCSKCDHVNSVLPFHTT